MFLKHFSQSHLSRDARLLTAATGVFCVSFMGIQMLLKPLYILRLGYGVEYLGLFGATGALSYLIMSVPSGMLSSYWGARPTMLLGGVITIIGMGILPLVEYLPDAWHTAWPIFTQAVLTTGWAFFNVNLVPALMAATTAETRNSAFALNSTLRGFGALLGMVSGGLLPNLFAWQGGFTLDMPDPYRLGLLLSALLGIAGLAPLFLLQARPPMATYTVDQPRAGFPLFAFLLLIFHVFFAQAGIAVCQTFCTAYMDTDLQLMPSIIGLITGAGQLAAVLAPLLTPRLAARYGNAWVLMATTLCSALSLIPLALIPTWFGVGVGGLGVMALAAMWMPTLQVFQMELVNARWRAIAYGILSMAMSVTYGSTSYFGGHFVAAWGYQNLFLLSIGLSLVGVILMWGMSLTTARLAVRQQA